MEKYTKSSEIPLLIMIRWLVSDQSSHVVVDYNYKLWVKQQWSEGNNSSHHLEERNSSG